MLTPPPDQTDPIIDMLAFAGLCGFVGILVRIVYDFIRDLARKD